jgi:hypothetical protein
MKKVLTVLFFTFSLAVAAWTQTQPVAKAGDPALTVVNGEGKSFVFTAADLAKLPRAQTKAKDHDGKEIAFEGVSVADVLKLAGVKLGGDTMRGKRLAEYLLVEAKDNYRAVFSLTEFDPEFTDTIILLADKADGKALDEKTGPWQIIVPNQNKHGRWVRQVIRFTVKTAEAEGVTPSDDAIYEFMFRNLVKPWMPGTVKPTDTFCLAISSREDPKDELLAKLGDLGVKLKKVSGCTILLKERDRVIDKDTKNPARVFSVSRPVWVNKEEVKVNAGYYRTNMESGSCTYTLRFTNGQWAIENKEKCVES